MDMPELKSPKELIDAAKEAASAAAEKMTERLPNPDLDENGNPIVYSRLNDLPTGEAPDTITPGCLVLEGGAFRGLYTQGVLDALMQEGINFQTTIGISAGALSGIGYVAGQIGWAARINLTYRHNPNYIGTDAMKRDHGITGFSFLFNDALKEHPINEARFHDPRRRFVVGTTDLNTGEEEYFEKGKCADILKAAQASATVPYISRPVVIDGVPYLDGGLVVNIPYHWAKLEKFRKIIVVKTRDRSYRAEIGEHKRLNQLFYGSYPNLLDKLNYNDVRYNCLLDEIDVDEQAGHIFVIAPSKPVEISRFEGDMEKLGDLYWEGYHDMQQEMPRLKEYLRL